MQAGGHRFESDILHEEMGIVDKEGLSRRDDPVIERVIGILSQKRGKLSR